MARLELFLGGGKAGVGTGCPCEDARLRYQVSDLLLCKSTSQPHFRKVALLKCARRAWWLPRTAVQPCPCAGHTSGHPRPSFPSDSPLSRYSGMVCLLHMEPRRDGLGASLTLSSLGDFTPSIKPTRCWRQLSTVLTQCTGF